MMDLAASHFRKHCRATPSQWFPMVPKYGQLWWIWGMHRAHFGHTMTSALRTWNWEIMSAMCSPGGKVKFHIRGGTPNWDPRLSSKSLLYNQWEKHWSMVPTYTKIMLGTPQYQAMKDHEGMTNTLGWHSSTCFDDHDPTIELLRPFHSNNQFHYKKIWATGLCIKTWLAISTFRISKPQSRNSENRNALPKKQRPARASDKQRIGAQCRLQPESGGKPLCTIGCWSMRLVPPKKLTGPWAPAILRMGHIKSQKTIEIEHH